MVQRSMVKSTSLASLAAFPAASCAVARTRTVLLGALGTVHDQVPEFVSPVAMTFGKLAPPSVE